MVITEYCTGCGVCKTACPKQAIVMHEDEYGFMVPDINMELCVRCAICEKVCPDLNKPKMFNGKDLEVYAAINKNKDIQKSSASAGAFYSLAKDVLLEGGHVFGCAWESDLKVRHIEITSVSELCRLQKSKYVQSDVGECYQRTKDLLSQDIRVLFSGTPCQIAGLRNYLNKDYDNLVLVDIICHGVPSHRMFSSFIDSLEQKTGKKVCKYDFRYKDERAGNFLSKVEFDDKTKLKQWQELSYTYLFMNAYIYRPSCYKCKYANIERVSDITLGDYWNVKTVHPEVNDKEGVSLIIVNSEKGKQLVKKLELSMDLTKSNIVSAMDNNAQLKHPSIKPDSYDKLMENWKNEGYYSVEKFYHKNDIEIFKAKARYMVYRYTPKKIKLLAKRIIQRKG